MKKNPPIWIPPGEGEIRPENGAPQCFSSASYLSQMGRKQLWNSGASKIKRREAWRELGWSPTAGFSRIFLIDGSLYGWYMKLFSARPKSKFGRPLPPWEVWSFRSNTAPTMLPMNPILMASPLSTTPGSSDSLTTPHPLTRSPTRTACPRIYCLL